MSVNPRDCKKEIGKQNQNSANRVLPLINATLKMSGLPLDTKEDDLLLFWKDFEYVPESVKIFQPDGESLATGYFQESYSIGVMH